jgi:hypothetical protein
MLAVWLTAPQLLFACGDDDDGGTRYQVSCDRACDRQYECDSNVNPETCSMNCTEDTADIGPNLRVDFLAGIDACVDALTCNQLAAATVFQTCQREAAVRLAPSPAANQLCQAVVDSIQECSGLTVGTAGCLETVKIFSDSALLSAQSCENESCNERTACLNAALGTDPGAQGRP